MYTCTRYIPLFYNNIIACYTFALTLTLYMYVVRFVFLFVRALRYYFLSLTPCRSDRERSILQGKLRAAGKVTAESATVPSIEKKGDQRQEKVFIFIIPYYSSYILCIRAVPTCILAIPSLISLLFCTYSIYVDMCNYTDAHLISPMYIHSYIIVINTHICTYTCMCTYC